jgi:hypothetical protein
MTKIKVADPRTARVSDLPESHDGFDRGGGGMEGGGFPGGGGGRGRR